MKTPPLLIGAALLFWGWQTELWIFAVALAGIYECSHRVRWRWNLRTKDFRQLTLLATILLLVLLVSVAMSDSDSYFLYVLLRWLPLVFFPLLVGQAYSTSEGIDYRALFLFRSLSGEKNKNRKATLFHPSYPYFGVCLLSAAAANVGGGMFYIGLIGLSAAALWNMRSRRYSTAVWLCLFTVAGVAGLAGHSGLHALHAVLEEKGLEWLSDANRQDLNPDRTRTAIGDIGSLKPSERILFRVKTDSPSLRGLLLREAVYDAYSYGSWFATAAAFVPLQPDASPATWRIAAGQPKHKKLEVISYHHRGRGILKLPAGAFQVDDLPVESLERNRFGSVKVEGGPEVVSYRIRYAAGHETISPPSAMDRHVPDRHRPVIDRLTIQLGLAGKSPRGALTCLASFFETNFTYSLDSRPRARGVDPLASFLLQTRSGHCEYFASATVLLLRAAGIPARYARGYSVYEFSGLENRFIVRDRHAHAWTLVFIDGNWINMDTTPSAWREIEEARAPVWQMGVDILSYGWLQFKRGLQSFREDVNLSQWWWMIMPVALLWAGRLIRKQNRQQLPACRSPRIDSNQNRPATDSGFDRIEIALKKLGFIRHPSETRAQWLTKLRCKHPQTGKFDRLKDLLNLHYRHSFDPAGINADELAALESGVDDWLDDHLPYCKSQS